MHAVCTVNCTSRCHLHGTVRDGKLIRVEPGNMPGRPGYANACLRSMSYIKHVQDENARVMHPMKRTGERGSGEFEQITWEQAIDIIAEKLNAVVAKDPKNASFYSFTGDLGKLSWEAPTRFAGCLGATTWDVEGIMGDHGASMGMTMVFGTHRGAHDSRDYLNSNLVICWGRNLADTHTSELRDYVAARKNGAKVIVIDPRQCSTAAMADEWIGINPQTDPRPGARHDELDHRPRPARERQAGRGIRCPVPHSRGQRQVPAHGRRQGRRKHRRRRSRRNVHRLHARFPGRRRFGRAHVRDLGRVDRRRCGRP